MFRCSHAIIRERKRAALFFRPLVRCMITVNHIDRAAFESTHELQLMMLTFN